MSTSLQYRRLRAPKHHGETLQQPPLSAAAQLLSSNLSTNRQTVSVGEHSLSELAAIGRKEVFQLAMKHSQEYRDTDFDAAAELSQIVMSGHQPSLFHPGVWIKNFALSSLGKHLNSVAINLVVDNDICGVASVKTPRFDGKSASFQLLPIDQAWDNVPFENRAIQSDEMFDSFATRAQTTMSEFVDAPLVRKLWQPAADIRKQNPNLGYVLAALRHRLESEIGLSTLEVPISQVAQTTAFAEMVQHLFIHSNRFAETYNTSLDEYRKLHKIRSRSHPVPELATQDGFVETPCWIWSQQQPIRGRLFVKTTEREIVLSNLRDIEIKLERSEFVTQFLELGKTGIAVRPRALLTTMFARCVLSDLFLHGIGGAKYDQLTDEIIRKFFGFTPPEFMTLSATLKLPTNVGSANESDLSRLKQRLRDFEYHPEKNLPLNQSPDVAKLVSQKQSWIETALPRGERLERHKAITNCNELLRPLVEPQRTSVLEEVQTTSELVRISKILGSREFSFCLFPESLVDELVNLTSL